jgi:hypothetical protein
MHMYVLLGESWPGLSVQGAWAILPMKFQVDTYHILHFNLVYLGPQWTGAAS